MHVPYYSPKTNSMKRNVLIFIFSLLAVFYAANAQTEETIIFLDFQDWEASPGVKSDPLDSCELGAPTITGPNKVLINYETGGSGEVTLWKYFVSPVCECKHMNRDGTACGIDITPGWVNLGKQPNPEDTIGQFILPKLSNVTKIEVGFSCTGDGRGMCIYASTDDGETWGDPIGGEHQDGNQDGVFATEDINMDNVIIKLTSGTSADGTSQFTRIHNVEVWGVPGGPETGVSDIRATGINAYYTPGRGLVIEGDVMSVAVYDITGRRLVESFESGTQTIPLPSLANGVYFVKAFDRDNKVYTQKFLIK